MLVKFESAMTYCASLPIPTQVFRRSTTPVEWYEVHPDLLDVGGMMYISLVYSTEVPRLYDLYFEDVRGAQIPYAEFDKGSILNGFQQLMQRVTGGNIGSVASGAIYARRSGSHEDDTYRNALATVWTWSASDIDGGVDYRRDPIYKVGQLTGAGAVAGLPYRHWSIGRRPDTWPLRRGWIPAPLCPGLSAAIRPIYRSASVTNTSTATGPLLTLHSWRSATGM
ncbi:MAG: hypothetical protein IPK52_27640 [Chloroflexi bacterium]|nr:hypothetical protein [Chloroflexota bacterium]